ncbi:MAG: hypothetical protein HOW73_27350 [Polyangiaceae bacterium]|nr:hypothetical protein [Polyangiaceae bacterium]
MPLDGFASLFTPITPPVLAEEYWGKKPLLVRGRADKFDDLFDKQRLARALKVAQSEAMLHHHLAPAVSVHASFERGSKSTPGKERVNILPSQYYEMLAAGATVCIMGLESLDAELCDLAGRIKVELGYPGDVGFRSYHSIRDTGFSTHFDAPSTASLQIIGHKKWRYSRQPAVDWPFDNGYYREYESPARATEPWRSLPLEEFEEVTLGPGDLLMLPAGTWHTADAIHEETLGLTLSFGRISPLKLIQEALMARLSSDPKWRGMSLRPRPPGKLREAAYDPDFAALLREAAAQLHAMQEAPSALWNAWARRTADRNLSLDRRPRRQPPGRPLATTRMTTNDRAPAAVLEERTADGGRIVSVFLPNDPNASASARVELDDPDHIAWFEEVLRQGSFTAAESLAWRARGNMSEETVYDLLEDLCAVGVLHFDGAAR